MIDNLPPLRSVIEKYELAAKKALGQNFLLDLNLTAKIARHAGVTPDCHVLEIGPGPGGLTRALLAQGAYVTAIERDERCLPALQDISDAYPGRLTVIHADALTCDYANLFDAHQLGHIKIVANLPYNIGTQLLINWLTQGQWPPFYQSMTLMFQKEVAQRITATVNDSHYGRLSILAQWRCDPHSVFDLPPQAFSPPPKVTSSVVHFIPNATPIDCQLEKLEIVTQAAFGQRRKMLRQSLKSIGGEALLNRAGIDPTRRAETLTIAEFAKLANHLSTSQT